MFRVKDYFTTLFNGSLFDQPTLPKSVGCLLNLDVKCSVYYVKNIENDRQIVSRVFTSPFIEHN